MLSPRSDQVADRGALQSSCFYYSISTKQQNSSVRILQARQDGATTPAELQMDTEQDRKVCSKVNLHLFLCCMFMCTPGLSSSMKARGPPGEVVPCLLSCGSWGPNTGQQAWQEHLGSDSGTLADKLNTYCFMTRS